MKLDAGFAFALCLLGVFLAGCALTSKGSALSPRFFSPEVEGSAQSSSAASSRPLALRLGLVEAASHLEERISYRVHASELGYYEDRRWSERPEEYLRRALEEELFERGPVRRILSGAGTTLDIELTAFEELQGAGGRVRLALRFRLHDDREASLEKSLVVERALEADGDADHAQRIASALGLALRAAVAEVGADVIRHLETRPGAPAPATESIARAKEPSAPVPRSPSDSESR